MQEALNQNFLKKLWMLGIILGFVGLCQLSLSAQSSSSVKVTKPNDAIGADKSQPSDDTQAPSPMEEEMRAKRAIRFAEKEYQDNVDRARELSILGKELLSGFKQKRSLAREGNKKLERIEKLTKRVRGEAGGSEDELTIDKPPEDLASAISRIAEVSESLRTNVEKTPRQVVSASVICEANVLLELVRMVRAFLAKG